VKVEPGNCSDVRVVPFSRNLYESVLAPGASICPSIRIPRLLRQIVAGPQILAPGQLRQARLARSRGELYVGAENWPFPVPLVSKNSRWYFDSSAGAKEILFRRVGENESIAIDTCLALILASKRHNAGARAYDPINQYARAFASDQERNGAETPPKNELSGPFYGYLYRTVAQGSKGIDLSGSTAVVAIFVAYPARYRSTGVMTFVVTQDNVVYEEDFGPNTTKTAESMAGWRPDSRWHVTE
jgi:Protein of unknown function (DUF2950)